MDAETNTTGTHSVGFSPNSIDCEITPTAAILRLAQRDDELRVMSLLDVFLTYETYPQHVESLRQFAAVEMDTEAVNSGVSALVDAGIVEEIDDTDPQEYRLNMSHSMSQPLVELHTELHNHGPEIINQYDGSQTEAWVCALRDVLLHQATNAGRNMNPGE